MAPSARVTEAATVGAAAETGTSTAAPAVATEAPADADGPQDLFNNFRQAPVVPVQEEVMSRFGKALERANAGPLEAPTAALAPVEAPGRRRVRRRLGREGAWPPRTPTAGRAGRRTAAAAPRQLDRCIRRWSRRSPRPPARPTVALEQYRKLAGEPAPVAARSRRQGRHDRERGRRRGQDAHRGQPGAHAERLLQAPRAAHRLRPAPSDACTRRFQIPGTPGVSDIIDASG